MTKYRVQIETEDKLRAKMFAELLTSYVYTDEEVLVIPLEEDDDENLDEVQESNEE